MTWALLGGAVLRGLEPSRAHHVCALRRFYCGIGAPAAAKVYDIDQGLAVTEFEVGCEAFPLTTLRRWY